MPIEHEEQRRIHEEQAAKDKQARELYQERYERRKQEKREFTARKKAGLLTPEELKAENERLEKKREWFKAWRWMKGAADLPAAANQ